MAARPDAPVATPVVLCDAQTYAHFRADRAEGLVGGIGGFEIMPDLGEISILGSSQSIGNDLVGTYYDFKRDRKGTYKGIDADTWRGELNLFMRKGWNPRSFSKYYRSPRKLYSTCLVVPPVLSSIAPAAFGDADAEGVFWAVHYKGQLVHQEDITFRFWGCADETIGIRVDGKIVFGACYQGVTSSGNNLEPIVFGSLWNSSTLESRKYGMGNSTAAVGDWITLKAGVSVNIDILIGDNGGQASFMLAVQEKGIEYEKNGQGGPILPAFKTAGITRDLMDVIYKDLVEDEISLTTGPVFNDFGVPDSSPETGASPVEEMVATVEPDPTAGAASAMRTWEFSGAKTVEAELVTVMAGQAVLKNQKGKTIKVPIDRFNQTDREYIELSKPPEFNINFTKNSKQRLFRTKQESGDPRPPQTLSRYGVRIEQTGSGAYNHELQVDLFAIGKERLGDRYILLDHQKTAFTPTVDNNKCHEFISERTVVLDNYQVDAEPRGEKYAGYLVTVTDKRGHVISMDTSSPWLHGHIENLKKQKPGNYMDKTCCRVFPTRPPKTRY